ncbi:MAG: hypothetical protein Q9218_001783 [Villophora microphyllina]
MDMLFEKRTMTENLTSRSGHSSPGILKPIDASMERRVLRKCDLHVIPFLAVLYLLAFLDRVNVGNARIQGLEDDLNMRGHDFNVALQVFFIPYILFEVPSNILIRKVAPSAWISVNMTCWGIITVCMGLTRSYTGLVICRFLLGIFEAGFVSGCIYLISMYYKRHELQRRWNLFYTAGILASALSGLLAYALANMAGIGGYGGWRWIFIIEGLATVVFAVAGKFILADWPETAEFLTLEERTFVIRRTQEEMAGAVMDRLDSKSWRRVVCDWKIWIGVIMYLGDTNAGYSGSFFNATILRQVGWTSVNAQLLSVPIYALAALVAVIVGFLSDRLRHRYAFCMLGVCIATVGWSLLLAQDHISVVAQYIALYLVTVGTYITSPLSIIWMNNNLGGHYKRGIGAALQIALGNLGGITASNIYITKQAPTFPVGFGVSLALQWLTAAACTAFFAGLVVENRKRDRGERDYRYDLAKAELDNLGDDHPNFRFVY